MSVLDHDISKHMTPRGSWIGYLTSIDHGEVDRLMEFGDVERPHPYWFRTPQEANEQAWGYYEDVTSGSLYRRGYIEVSRPSPDGDGFAVMVSLTLRGHECLRALNALLVWSTEDHAPNEDATVAFWIGFLSASLVPSGQYFDHFVLTTHPMHNRVREAIPEIRRKTWLRLIPAINKPTDPFFKEIDSLPESYADVKAEAFHRKMQIWAPK
ncbi:MAG: hypothetical protein EOP83_05925 [Verrucomicrobiaceae bacterium]|nr:MAG: hypothetical protein EOP83_05925 [Verrucomicrobiaceae bacterium]